MKLFQEEFFHQKFVSEGVCFRRSLFQQKFDSLGVCFRRSLFQKKEFYFRKSLFQKEFVSEGACFRRSLFQKEFVSDVLEMLMIILYPESDLNFLEDSPLYLFLPHGIISC